MLKEVERVLSSKEEKIAALKLKAGRVYWMRFGLSIFSAILCAFLRSNVEGLGVGVAIYLISYLLARHVVKPEVNLGKYEIYLLGLGTYFFTWVTLWILLHTLLKTI